MQTIMQFGTFGPFLDYSTYESFRVVFICLIIITNQRSTTHNNTNNYLKKNICMFVLNKIISYVVLQAVVYKSESLPNTYRIYSIRIPTT